MNAWHGLLPGPGRGRRRPHRAGVRRCLHQPAEDRLRPELGLVGRAAEAQSAWAVLIASVLGRAGSGCGLARCGGSRVGLAAGPDRGHPAAAAAGLGDHEGDLRVPFVLR